MRALQTITLKQFKRLIERVIKEKSEASVVSKKAFASSVRERGAILGPAGAERGFAMRETGTSPFFNHAEKFFQYEPPVEQRFGRLRALRSGGKRIPIASAEALPEGAVKKEFIEGPIEEMRRRFFNAPQYYVPGQRRHTAKALRETPPYYTKEVVEPIVQPKVAKARKAVKEVAEVPLERELRLAQRAQALWSRLGGKRTIRGQTWEEFRKRSTFKHKVLDAMDYFTIMYVKFKTEPQKFAKLYPRQLKEMREVIEFFGD